MFESHKISKRATKKGAPHSGQDEDGSLDNSPDTDFSCDDKPQEGLYADIETDCKYFHLCQKSKNGHLHLVSTFACPPGTSFNQYEGNCDASKEIDCEIFSQPEHSFARSKSRNKRNVFKDILSPEVSKLPLSVNHRKRNADEDNPDTNFSCEDKLQEGLYADTETDCKYFHLCQKNKRGHLHLVSTFVCPPGTSFNQHEGNCDASKEIDCEIFSQPEHSFARSKSRNKRHVFKDILSPEVSKSPLSVNHRKRNADQDNPDTNFSCEDKLQEGLYADTETNCKYFHLCHKNKSGHLHIVSTFVCPLGTSFNQHEGNCDASKEIDCEIYSQPEHSFARSKSRNKRNVLEENSDKGTKHKLHHLVNRHKDILLDNSPDTDFSCEDKPQEGLYADTETNCKYFHLCQKNKNGRLYLASTFVCPAGTAFNQHEGNCDASEEIDCEIYSQPEHLFERSKIRNKRSTGKDHPSTADNNILPYLINRHKRNADHDSTESYYTDDEIHSAERDEPSHASYENISDDEMYDTSVEDTQTEESDLSHENNKSDKQDRKHRNKQNSAENPVENCDENSNECSEVETSEEEEEGTETHSHEHSEVQSNEKEEYSNESKETYTSEEINNSQESHDTEESNESVSNKDRTLKTTDNRKHEESQTETENADSEQDSASVENNTKEEDNEEAVAQDSHEESSSERDISKNKKIEEKADDEDNDDDDRTESKISEESIISKPLNKHLKTESEQMIKNSANDKDTVDVKQTDEINVKNVNDFNTSTEYNSDVSDTNEKPSMKDSHSKLKENSKQIVHDYEDSSTEAIVQLKKDNVNSPKDSQEDESKTSFERKESGNTFKSKVSQLLMKLNASVEDIHSIDANTTNDDYYDYYTYDESLLELEELKEKILSADNSAKNKQNHTKSEGENSSEIENFREQILAKELPELTTKRQNSTKLTIPDKLKDTEKSEFLHKNETKDSASSSLSHSDEYERSSLETESGIPTTTKVPERLKISTEDDLLITTSININNDKMIDNGSGKSEHTTDIVNSSGTDIPEKSALDVVDKYEMSTEYQSKSTDYSEVTSKQDPATEIPVAVFSLGQIKKEATKDDNNKTLKSLPTDNSIESSTDIPKKEIPFTDSNEDTDSTTEILITTFSPDTSTSTTTPVPTTTSNLLHPYKSRPVYRTWRTTPPPPPVSIRPNSSLRLPRPSIRRGTNKGTHTMGSNAVNNAEKERPSSRNEHTNQVLPQEKSKEHEVKSKYASRGSFKDKPVESALKPSADEVPLPHTTVTQLPFEEAPLTVTSMTNATSTENSPITITQDPEQKTYSDSKSENSDKAVSYTSLEDYRTVGYDGMTPSPVLPTFSRKNFFIDREDEKVTKPGITTTTATITTTTPTSTTQFQSITESPSITEIPLEQIYSFTSVEAQTPQSYDVYKDTKSESFTCSGKELHQYLPDPLDCHLFHYCSPGFHSRQLLDFRFMCDKGTAFSPVTHHCEIEDETLCGNLHN